MPSNFVRKIIYLLEFPKYKGDNSKEMAVTVTYEIRVEWGNKKDSRGKAL